jgi:hypothetical protein
MRDVADGIVFVLWFCIGVWHVVIALKNCSEKSTQE